MNHPTSVNRAQCPGCGASETDVFFELNSIPVNCSALWDTRAEATSCPRGSIGLAFCETCGLVFNGYYDARALEYDDNYENSLDFSPTFKRYASGLAKQLVSRHSLHEKRVLDIGSGKGEFLRSLAENGAKECVGFDPSYDGGDASEAPSNLRFVQGYYGKAYASEPVDFVCCRHVLEHMAEPLGFLRELRQTLAEHGDVHGYFEVPNGDPVFSGPGMWDVIYPHVSYFTSESLRTLFETAGFTVIECGRAYSGQFLFIEVAVAVEQHVRQSKTESQRYSEVNRTRRAITGFAQTFEQSIAAWSDFLESAAARKQRVAFWGAGAKGVTFLNVVPTAKNIEAIVDLNVRKHGNYVPGSGQRISGPEALRRKAPEYVVSLNPVYAGEISSMLSEMGLEAEVVTTASKASAVAGAR